MTIDVDSSPGFSITVTCEEQSPADLPTFLRAIQNVKVVDALVPGKEVVASKIFVFPLGEFNASDVSQLIERQMEQWFKWRTDTVTVEIRRPDGHLQVFTRQKD